jgi:hypothetical protein
MREALTNWTKNVGDFSDTTELQMAEDFWPNGEQPVTQPPTISINKAGMANIVPAAANDSIGYRINGGTWKLYSQPVLVPKSAILEAKSVRYGWAESALVKTSG